MGKLYLNPKDFEFKCTEERIYNLSDINWEDDTLSTGRGDIDGSDPSMDGYNKGWQMDPYQQRYYANKRNLIDKRGVTMSRLKLSAKEVIDISSTAHNYAREILTLWAETDGPLQNFFEGFTMNKLDNKMKKDIADILNTMGYKVYPVLTDEKVRHAGVNDFREFRDIQLSDESLTAIENRLSGNADPFYTSRSQNGGPTIELGFDETTQMNSDIGVPPNNYEVRISRLKKKTIVADQIESIPYSEILDAISQGSRNVSILLNRKLQVAPVFIKQIRKQADTNAVPPDQNYYNNVDMVNIITVYEIWKVFLDYEKTNMNDCFVVISGDFTLQGYRNGKWSNVQYCGFYSSPQEAENEISGYFK